MQHRGVQSFLLLEYCLEDDVLEAIEGGRSAFHPHAKNCTLPGGQEEFGQIHGIEAGINFTGLLRFGDARGKRHAPFLENRIQPLAQEFALRAGLKAEISNQAAAFPSLTFQLSADDVQIPPEPLPGSKRLVVQSLADMPLGISEEAV